MVPVELVSENFSLKSLMILLLLIFNFVSKLYFYSYELGTS